MTQLEWGADGVARGNFTGINVWAVCGVPVDKIVYLKSCGIRDSKKTLSYQRYSLYKCIERICKVGIGYVTVKEINDFGKPGQPNIDLVESLALERAIKDLQSKGLNPVDIWGDLGSPDIITNRMQDADSHMICVSAASIAAKYFLDCWWREVEKRYPELKKYHFSENAGYGVNAKKYLEQYGVCQFHRINYKPVQEVLKNARNSA